MKISVVKTGRAIKIRRACDRHCFTKLGIPALTALDATSAASANMLVENREDAPCLELSADATLKSSGDFVIALTGADFDVSIGDEMLPHYCAVQIDNGNEIRIRKKNGNCLYIAVNGDIRESARGLCSGDDIEIDNPHESLVNMDLRALQPAAFDDNALLRLIPGPDAALFDTDALDILYNEEFAVERVSDYELSLSGKQIRMTQKSAYPCYSPAGNVWVGEDMQLHISLPGAPLTRHEISAGVVIDCDMSALAQLYKGCRLRFSPCTVEAAQKLIIIKRTEYLTSYIKMNTYEV